jgi:arylsulfatase A-like enzyme
MTIRPNLIFIFTDEQRFDTLAAYGNTHIAVPSLNRLAAQSVVFERAYVTQAVCTPSRASLLTGLYPHSHGLTENNLPLPASIPCLPEMMDTSDYAVSYHGKWHLGDEIFAQHGFEQFVSIEDEYARYYSPGRDPNAQSSYHQFLVENGFTPANGRIFGREEAAHLPEEYGKPAFLAGTASQFIREHQKQPFILYVNFLEPHMPFTSPRDDQYDPERVLLPQNFNQLPGLDNPLKTRLFQQTYYERGLGLPLKSEADWRRMVAHYWGLCSLVDTHVGAILDTLEDCALQDHTIVVFTSDHGDMMGSHRLIAKCVQFEEAVRVPFLLRLPGQTRGMHVKNPTSQIDIVPTLLDLLGQRIPDHLQGKSLRPWFDSAARDRQVEDIMIEWNGHNNGFGDVNGKVSIPEAMRTLASEEEIIRTTTDPVRTVITPDGWKLNYSPAGEHELYNLEQDPFETHNLAFQPTQQPRIHALVDRIRRWQTHTQDTVSI